VTWLGIAANLALAIPTLLVPDLMLRLTDLPAAEPIMWPRFAALLLILLSMFYIPAAKDPDRYRATAWTAVGSRLVGVLFFLTQPRIYLMFGLFDLVFFVPEAVLLRRATRQDAAVTTPSGSAA
jgi:hypothetical protein